MISIITRIQIEGNDTVSFLNGTNYVQGMSQIMPQVPTYISYGYDSISITQDGSKTFQFSVYTVTDVGGNSFTALNFQDPSDVVQAKTIEIYRLLVTAIFKGCCECGNTEPECSIQYTAGNGEVSGTLLIDGADIRINYFTANNQDFTGFWPIIQDGSWIFIFSKTDPTVYGVFQLSNYVDGGPGVFAQFDITLLAGTDIFPEGTSLCVDVTSVGGSLVQDWQDTLNISSLLTQNNLIDGGGFNFEWENVNRYIINATGYQSYISTDGSSVGQVYIQPGGVTITGTNFIDVITPGWATATPGMVLALDSSGHVEYTLAGTGTISSIGLFMPPAFTVSTPNPLTSNGDFTVTGAGTDLQYINGLGELATFPVYTVENGLHAFGGVPGETPPDPFLFHLGGELVEDTVITTTNGTAEYVLGVSGTADQNTRRPFAVANLGDGGAAVFSDFGAGVRPNPTVEIITDNDLLQPILRLTMQGNLPDADNTMLRLRYSGRPDLATTTIDYQFRNNNAVAANSNFIGSRLSTEVVSFVDNNEETRFNLQLIEDGALADKLQVQGYGQLVLNEYGLNVFSNGVSNIDNDLEYVLAVDSSGNVYKKISEGGGTVTEVSATGLLTTSPDPITTTGTVTSEMNSGFLVGRYDDGLGVFQEITVGTGLTLSATGELTADGGGTTYTVDNGLSPDPLNADNFQLGGTLLKDTTIDTQEFGLGVFRPSGLTNPAFSAPFGVVNGDGLNIAAVFSNTPSAGNSPVAQFFDNETTPNFAPSEIIHLVKNSSLNVNQVGIRMSKFPNGVGSSLSIDYDFNGGYVTPFVAGVAGRNNVVVTDASISTYSTSFEIHTALGSFETIPGSGIYQPITLRKMAITGPGQLILDNYTTSTAFASSSGTSVGVLNVDATGKVFVGTGGGGGGTYASAQGIWTEPGSPETFMLGAPSAAEALSDIPFSGTDRYIYTADRFLKINGANEFGAIFQVENAGYSAASFRSEVYVAGFLATDAAASGSYAIYSETVAPSSNPLYVVNNYSGANNTIENVINARRYLADGASANGIGTRINFESADGDAGVSQLGTIEFWASDASISNFTSNFDVYTNNAGAGISKQLTVKGSGQLNLDKYGETPANFPDASPVWALGVNATGDVVEFDVPTGGGGIPFGIATGTDTYAVTAGTASTYTDGDAYLVRFTNGNTGGSTLNVNGIGDADMYSNSDGLLIGGDIWAGAQMLCIYNSSLPGFQCIGTSTNSLFAYVTNAEATTITKGTAVYASGGTGDRMTVNKALATGDSTSAQTVGMVFADIAAGQKGIILIQGELVGLNLFPTSGGGENWSDGEPVYLSATTAGAVTRVKQYAPNHLVYLGICVKASNGSAGRMYVRIQNGFELDELHNVQAQTPANKDTLWYDNTVTPKQWKTASVPSLSGTFSLGVTVDGSGGVITAGVKGYVRVPYACTINSWSILTGNSGLGATITFDIWRANNAIPTVGGSLVGGGTKPFLASSTAQITSASPSGWTSVTLAANDILGFNVESGAAVFSWANLQLLVTKI